MKINKQKQIRNISHKKNFEDWIDEFHGTGRTYLYLKIHSKSKREMNQKQNDTTRTDIDVMITHEDSPLPEIFWTSIDAKPNQISLGTTNPKIYGRLHVSREDT